MKSKSPSPFQVQKIGIAKRYSQMTILMQEAFNLEEMNMETNHVAFERREIIDSHHRMLWEVPLEEATR